MKIWICIPVFNRKDLTLRCLATLYQQSFTNFKIVICDHGSTDGTSETIREHYPNVIIINADSSLWWAGAINRCITYVLANADNEDNEDTILTLNDDTELPEDYLYNLSKNHNKYPNSIITSVIINIKSKLIADIGYRKNWVMATTKPVNFNDDHVDNDKNIIELSHATGRGTLFPIIVFYKIGFFDEKHLPHYGADDDFSFKAANAGFKIYVSQECRVFSYIEETGQATVLSKLTIKSFINYFFGIRSPANLNARFWVGWNNCPKFLLPSYLIFDFIRVTGGYFKYFILKKSQLKH